MQSTDSRLHHRWHRLARLLFTLVAGMMAVFVLGIPSVSASVPTQPEVNQTVYVGAAHFSGNRIIVTVDALQGKSGRKLWHRELSSQSTFGPLIAADGEVYVVTATQPKISDSLDALQGNNGRLLWQRHTDLIFQVAAHNGVVYVGTNNFSGSTTTSMVDALRTTDGSRLWQHKIDGELEGGLAVTESAVYVGVASSSDSVLALRTQDGSRLWRHTIESSTSSLAELTASESAVYFTTPSFKQTAGSVEALRASDGALLWQHDLRNGHLEQTVTGRKVYVSNADGSLCAWRSSDGTQVWCHQTNSGVNSFGAAEKVVSITSFDGSLCALRVSDGTQLLCTTAGSGFSTLAVTKTVVYSASVDGSVSALRASNGSTLWHRTIGANIFGLAVDE
jgi:outer membrane protein assembly factor BamB